ncbi:MAG: DUF697 domain-containing protein [Nitrospirae bacterium]|nr:DUF697 domain-containing protein [Nitrospirota bacterium]
MHHDEQIAAEAVQEEIKPTTNNDSTRLKEADKIVKKSVFVAVGIGFIPVPIVDVFALTSLQLFTIKKLSMHYNIEFSKDRGKSIIASLISSIVPVSLSETVFSALKFIPIIGYPTSLLALPALGGASTYAIGKVFIQHFEAGGTFLDLDPNKMKDYFIEQYKKGQELVKDLKGKKTDHSQS